MTKLIALDLDGTTLTPDGHVSPYTRRMLQTAAASGIHVVIASGRALTALPDEVLDIPQITYAITSNGSSIYHLPTKQRIYARDLAPATVTALLDRLQPHPVFFEAFTNDGLAYTDARYYTSPSAFGLPVRMEAYVHRTRKPIEDMAAFITGHSHCMEAMDIVVTDWNLRQFLRHELSSIPDLYITHSERYYLEFAAGTVSKASALQHLAGQLKVPDAAVTAFGDGINDSEMFSYAGCGVAMKNAAPELLSIADAVTGSNAEDGVAAYIEHHILKER